MSRFSKLDDDVFKQHDDLDTTEVDKILKTNPTRPMDIFTPVENPIEGNVEFPKPQPIIDAPPQPKEVVEPKKVEIEVPLVNPEIKTVSVTVVGSMKEFAENTKQCSMAFKLPEGKGIPVALNLIETNNNCMAGVLNMILFRGNTPLVIERNFGSKGVSDITASIPLGHVIYKDKAVHAAKWNQMTKELYQKFLPIIDLIKTKDLPKLQFTESDDKKMKDTWTMIPYSSLYKLLLDPYIQEQFKELPTLPNFNTPIKKSEIHNILQELENLFNTLRLHNEYTAVFNPGMTWLEAREKLPKDPKYNEISYMSTFSINVKFEIICADE